MTPMLARKRLKGPGGIHLPRNRSARGITRHRRISHPGNRKEEGTNNVEEDDATISFAMGRLEADSYACIVAGALLTWGMIDVWDGTAGLRTGLDKVRKRICRGAVDRKMSLAKTIFGSASMVLGAIGLLMVR